MKQEDSERGADVSGGLGKELALVPCSSSSAGPSSAYPAIGADVASKFYVYPQALAKYEDIVASPKVFMTTLEKLHATMQTKFMIPIIGGKELDLHQLFVEVTSRGGLEKVVRERRWKEITSVFKFPSTATNASFILRKYYVSLIHHYEQLYFFGAKGWRRIEPDPLQSPTATPIPVQGSIAPVALSDVQTPSAQQQTKVCPPLGSPVVGVIDGKFEHGYLVTVSVGAQKLHGVLYHFSGHHPSVNANNSIQGSRPLAVRRRRRRKKSEMKKRDPAHPKPNRSGYNFFFQEHHARLKPLHPGKDREISKMIGELWSKLTETEKVVYQDKGLRDKERYQIEMQEYRERLNSGQIISDAVPLQQRHAVPDQKMEDESDEDERMETEYHHSTPDGSSLGGSDSEEKTAGKDSSLNEIAVNAGNVGAEGDGFELRKRDDKVAIQHNVQDLNF